MAKAFVPKIRYSLREIPIKHIKVWGEAQARKLDRKSISELAKSIKHDGLLNPPLVQKVARNEYHLMSGQRRLAAMKRLKAKKIRVNVLTKKSEMSLEEAKAASVVENLHRNDMDNRDVVTAATMLTENMGKADAARYLGITRITLNNYLGYAGVPESLKELVPKIISRDSVTKLYLAVPNIKRAKNIALKIEGLDSQLKKQYITMLAKHPRTSHKKLLKLARASIIRQNVSVRLSKAKAKKLKKRAENRKLTPQQVAKQILEKHL